MKRFLLLSALSLLVLIFFGVFQLITFNDTKLHIVFCDVGQGDGILLKTPKNSYILIDSGPDNKVLGCLTRHMPLWDHTLAAAILTHPHQDHLAGFVGVLQGYSVGQFITERLANKTVGYKSLVASLKTDNIPQTLALAGDTLKTETVTLTFVGPTDTYLQNTSPRGFIGETGEFGSLETLVTFGKFRVLLTGDSQAAELQQALSLLSGKVTVLQVPHHGSKTGLSTDVLSVLKPQLAVISVGAHNKYGHPAPSTLDLLKQFGIRVLRTDQVGDVEVVSDGNNWEVR